jgi:uncharacterized protein (TIGR02147 family)
MASIFEHSDYKSFIRAHLATLPKQGHGEYRKIATHLKMHTTQVFGGSRDLTLEQAQLLGEYLGFNELEVDYLLTLVQRDRAGTLKLKRHYDKKLAQHRKQAAEIKSRLPAGKTLDDKDRAVFYSQWYYSAIRLLCSLPEYRAPDKISVALGLEISRVRDALAFLVSVGLCEEKNGSFHMTEARTHIERENPLSSRHHSNWRLRVLKDIEQTTDEDLIFTSPLTISKVSKAKIREKLLEMIQQVGKVVADSEPEELVYFGIDWLSIAPRSK